MYLCGTTSWENPVSLPGRPDPYKVKRKDWDSNTFLLDLGRKEDTVSLSLIESSLRPDWKQRDAVAGGRDIAPLGDSTVPRALKIKLRRSKTADSTGFLFFSFPFMIIRTSVHHVHDSSLSNIFSLSLGPTCAPSPQQGKVDGKKFWQSPFISKQLSTAEFVFVRDDTLAKSALALRYSGPYRVLARNWEKGVLRLKLSTEDNASMARLKAAIPISA